MKNVVITSVGRRVQLIRAFRASLAGTGIKVITVDAGRLVAAARYGDIHLTVPAFNGGQYVDALLDICREFEVGMLIPLHEAEFELLDKARGIFANNGTVLVLSAGEVLRTCKDKLLTYKFFRHNGFDAVPTYTVSESLTLAQTAYPLFVKPRTGMGSVNTFRVDDRMELEFLLNHVPDPLVQDYIEGIEYTMDVLNDLDGNTVAVVPRERIEVRSGEVSKSRTVKDWGLIEQTKAVAEALGGIGPLTIQAFKKQTGEIIFTEINPRFGGGVPLAIEAGVDYPLLLAKMVAGEKVPPQLGEFRDKLYMLRYDEALYLENLREKM